MKRSAIGEKVRTRVLSEAAQARVLEGDSTRPGLFYYHRVDWFHNETPQRDRGTLSEGVPDYLIIGRGWKAWLELKATSITTGRDGKLSTGQRKFQDLLIQAGDEVVNFTLPKGLRDLNDWLASKTGIIVDVDGLV